MNFHLLNIPLLICVIASKTLVCNEIIAIIYQTIVNVVETSLAKILSDLLSFTSLNQFLPSIILVLADLFFICIPLSNF